MVKIQGITQNTIWNKKQSTKIRETPFDNLFNGINNVFLALCFIIVLYPLLYIIACSLSDPKAVIEHRVTLFPVNFDLIQGGFCKQGYRTGIPQLHYLCSARNFY